MKEKKRKKKLTLAKMKDGGVKMNLKLFKTKNRKSRTKRKKESGKEIQNLFAGMKGENRMLRMVFF